MAPSNLSVRPDFEIHGLTAGINCVDLDLDPCTRAHKTATFYVHSTIYGIFTRLFLASIFENTCYLSICIRASHWMFCSDPIFAFTESFLDKLGRLTKTANVPPLQSSACKVTTRTLSRLLVNGPSHPVG